MKIVIKTTNIDLTPSLKDYTEKKIGELEKFFQMIRGKGQDFEKGKPPYEVWVELERTTRHHHKGRVFRAECQIRLPGRSLRAESVKEDIYLAIDDVRDELQREVDRYKQKQVSRYKRMARRMKNLIRFFIARD
jgi:putative sigma-54 modulation protein